MRRTPWLALSLALVAAVTLPGVISAATITPTVSSPSAKTALYVWAGMAGTDTAVSAFAGHCADLSVQVTGTFGTTTVTLQGSLDDSTYATLNDTAGTPAALSFTAAGYKHVQETALYLKPGLSGGTGTGLKVAVLCQLVP